MGTSGIEQFCALPRTQTRSIDDPYCHQTPCTSLGASEAAEDVPWHYEDMPNDAVKGWVAAAATQIALNGTTQGGVQGDKYTLRDVKAAVLSLLREKKKQIESTAAPLKRALARAKKIEKRWKRKGKGENMLAKMVEWQIRSWADGVEKFEAQIGMMKRSIEILEEYSFEMLPVDKNAANSAYMRTGPAYFATFQVR